MFLRLPSLLSLAAWALVTLAPPAQAQLPSGASVFGIASGTFQIGCSTCPHYVLTLVGSDQAPFMQAGGDGLTSAAAAVSLVPDRLLSGVPAEYTLGGSVAMAAQAGFEGALATPVLGLSATADNVQAFLPNPLTGPQMVGIDYYSAFVEAVTTQRYTYSGLVPATYTFSFSLTGSLTDERASLGARAGFFGDDLEVPLAASAVSYDGLPVAPVAPPPVQVNQSFSLAMLFNPGDAYTLQTVLSGGIQGMYASGLTSVQAMHTLRVTDVQGDLSLLHAELLPVPEPAGTWLWAAGLVGLGLQARRRRVQAGH